MTMRRTYGRDSCRDMTNSSGISNQMSRPRTNSRNTSSAFRTRSIACHRVDNESRRLSAIRNAYLKHPLDAEAILARLRREGKTLDTVTVEDLWHDEASSVTDQNHVGGIDATIRLAQLAGVTSSTVVWDLGSGLGGSGRALAHIFGCRVHGIEFTDTRCRDSRLLNDLTGLSHLVSVQCADMVSVEVPTQVADVLWGQAAWGHVVDRKAFFQRWSQALTPQGRIAIEEPCLLKTPLTAAERKALKSVERGWMEAVMPVDDWIHAIEPNGFRVDHREDMSLQLNAYLAETLGETGREVLHPEDELAFWRSAHELVGAGVIGYFRLIASRT